MTFLKSISSKLGMGSALGIPLGCSLGIVALSAASAVAAPLCIEPTDGPDAVIDSVSITVDDAKILTGTTIDDEFISCQSIYAQESGIVDLENSATLSLLATAEDHSETVGSTGFAEAESFGEIFDLRGVHQYVGSDDFLSIAALINRGAIAVSGSIDSQARAAGDEAFALATAGALGVMGVQQVSESLDGEAVSLIDNQGAVRTSSLTGATSDARADEALALAVGFSGGVFGIDQAAESSGGGATAILENSRLIDVRTGNTARATTRSLSGPSAAFAGAGAAGVSGIAQFSASDDGDSIALIENLGRVGVSISAAARSEAAADSGVSIAVAGALGAAGIGQISDSDTGRSSALLRNVGSVSIQAAVDATAVLDGMGLLSAIGGVSEIYAIAQEAAAWSGPRAEAVIENAGRMALDVSVNATGRAGDTDSLSTALIEASDIAGIRQVVEADRGAATIDNTGSVRLSANVRAVGSSLAGAQSSVAGIVQEGAGDNDQLLIRNAGRILVDTTVEATSATAAAAIARGAGIQQILDRGVVKVENAGSVLVDVTARAAGAPIDQREVIAEAGGLVIEGGDVDAGSEILNSGDLNVSAIAPNGQAAAYGIYVDLDRFSGAIRNVGSTARIETLAAGAETDSVAIGFADGTEIGAGTVVENDGGRIVAGRSDRVGDALRHGIAISLIDSDGDPLPGAPATIRLMGSDGPGTVFGKINIRSGDLIVVTDGETIFNGVVNNPVRRGTMAIGEDGVLTLARDAVNGAAQVNVDRFEQAADGTLIFEVGSSPDRTVAAGPPGNVIGQINANTVALNGEMQLRIAEGLYGNVVTYEDLVTATESIDGSWSAITVSSPLFTVRGTGAGASARARARARRSVHNLGLRLDRVPFSDVGGLTRNQSSAGRGIEGSYDALLAGDHAGSDYAALVQSLFALDADQYSAVMEDLHGAQYAQGLGSIMGSLDLLGQTVSSRLDGRRLTVARFDQDGAADETGANRDGLSTMWIAPQGAWSDVTGDAEAPGFDQTETAVHAGVDHQFTPNIRAGLVAGYFAAALDFDDDGGNDGAPLNYGGHQAGVFGQIDRGPAYLRGLASYGRYRGEARRFVDVGSAQGVLTGDFDADAWRAEVEAGHDVTVVDGRTITPYAGLAFAAGRYEAFEEQDDGTGAALSISGGSETVTSELGLRFEERVDWGHGGSLRLGGRASWLRDLTGTPARFAAAFAGIGGSDFSVRGSDRSPDTAAIDLDLSWTWSDRESGVAMADIGAGYRGRFNADATTHGVSARATLRF